MIEVKHSKLPQKKRCVLEPRIKAKSQKPKAKGVADIHFNITQRDSSFLFDALHTP
jgi:hypothetical protein